MIQPTVGGTRNRLASRWARASLGAVLSLAPALALSAGADGGGPPVDAAAQSRGVLHNGDSLAVGTQLYLPRALPGVGAT